MDLEEPKASNHYFGKRTMSKILFKINVSTSLTHYHSVHKTADVSKLIGCIVLSDVEVLATSPASLTIKGYIRKELAKVIVSPCKEYL